MIENDIQKPNGHNTHENNYCVVCNSPTIFVGLKYGYRKYCSKSCSGKGSVNVEKGKQTMLERYGCSNAFQLDWVRAKCNNEESIIKKKRKYKETCLERYGVETVLMLPEYRNDHLRDYNEIVRKFKETNLKKYGYTCTLNVPETRKQIRANKEQSYEWIPLADYEDFELYKYRVWECTNKQNIKSLDNYELRGRSDLSNSAHHLDHKYSMFQGFKDNIPPFIIGNICNLEMLYYFDNISKGKKCSITKEDLLSSFYCD